MPKPSETHPNARVYVGNIDYETRFRDLLKMFGRFGPIKDTYMPLDNEGRNKGFAFVEFEQAEHAATAVEKSQNLFGIGGRQIRVKIAEPRAANKNA